MIDLNKERIERSQGNNQFEKKGTNNTDKERRAKKFLCLMLACVVVFVGITCVFINRNNKMILAQQKIDAAENNKTSDSVTVADTQNIPATSEKTDDVTVAPADTTALTPDVTVGVTAAQPGTIYNPTIITIDEVNWHLTLVNSSYRIPEDYTPDLVYVCGSAERLDRKVAEKYEEMFNAALKDGVTLTPCSGYRSYETQERNYNRKIEFFEGQGYSTEEAKVKAATIIMPPGSSEHNLGYAMDIVCVEEWFEDTAEFKWLQENAADYGFIMRYPEDKQDITKVIYEPWHWRYVGVETAQELKNSGLVLEEYMGVA